MKQFPLISLSDSEWITIAFLLVLAVIALVYFSLRKRPGKPLAKEDLKSIPLPAEPDDQVVVNPTRANEPDGSVLVYRKEGVLVFDGVQIPMDKLVDAFVINVNENPYIPAAYHIQLNLGNHQFVQIPAGNDAEWAAEALKQLQEACARK
jgi:hypothetical protein